MTAKQLASKWLKEMIENLRRNVEADKARRKEKNESPRFPIGRCKNCDTPVDSNLANGHNIAYCSYECYCRG